jgi:hypothetical protein
MKYLQLITICYTCLFYLGCSHQPHYSEFSEPVLYANQDSGDCAFVKDACKYNNGLILAAWTDKKILRAKSDQDIGTNYEYGHIQKSDYEEFEKIISQLWVLNDPADGAPFHTATRSVFLKDYSNLSTFKWWYYFMPNNNENFTEVEKLINRLQEFDLINIRQYSWNELPRFGPPVYGHW